MDNYDIRMFRNSILSYINQSPLPAEVKFLAVKDIASQLEAEANKAVMQEAAELEKANEPPVDCSDNNKSKCNVINCFHKISSLRI